MNNAVNMKLSVSQLLLLCECSYFPVSKTLLLLRASPEVIPLLMSSEVTGR